MKLENKVAIVTGGAMGIGRAIALRLGKEGAGVVISDIDIEQANEVANEIKTMGCKSMAVKANVSNSYEVNQMIKAVLDRFEKIDILINNAGGSGRERKSLFCESTEDVWDYVISINLKGVLNCTRAVINHMISRRSGKIVNIASCAGMLGDVEMADYSAAKGGIISFTMALAKEVVSYGINETISLDKLEKLKQMTGFGRLGKPDEIAAMVLFLLSDEAQFISGQNYAVCGLRNIGGPV
jgi:NAD(P)-dependent dehydrogenase (short-subunit alcohol dehydrogenase family)